MERNDIIKALECCSKYYGVSTCARCPKWAEREFYKPCDITSESLALIKEVLEENESLKKTIDRLGKNNDEIARVYPLAIKEAEANTVQKMQEEINKTLSALCKGDVSEIRRMIDQIAKEMLEEGK